MLLEVLQHVRDRHHVVDPRLGWHEDRDMVDVVPGGRRSQLRRLGSASDAPSSSTKILVKPRSRASSRASEVPTPARKAWLPARGGRQSGASQPPSRPRGARSWRQATARTPPARRPTSCAHVPRLRTSAAGGPAPAGTLGLRGERRPISIILNQDELDLTLESAIALARSGDPAPLWRARVERLGGYGFKTYIAALGGALLAKATDPRVDSLAQDAKAGPRGYSLRSVTEFLAARNGGRYHLGAQGKNPVNNRPFLNGPARIDEFEKVGRAAVPAYREFLDALRHLNKLGREESLRALAAFLRVRMEVAEAERAADRRSLSVMSDLDPHELMGLCERFVRDRPEGGRKGQALAAAVLDCVFEDVVLQPINDPNPGDVRVIRGGRVTLPVEVKQVAVQEDAALDLARAARHLGASAALLVVLADDHVPLDRERVRREALRALGVTVEVCESVRELVGAVSVFGGGRTEEVLSRLPGAYAARMREHEVSTQAQVDWQELVSARGGGADRAPASSNGG